jgi:hypothetical protein
MGSEVGWLMIQSRDSPINQASPAFARPTSRAFRSRRAHLILRPERWIGWADRD